MKMQERIAAIILKNNKILLVAGYDESFYWTPGGKAEKGESHEKTLKRELKDELFIDIISMKNYIVYEAISEITGKRQKIYCYLVSYEGNYNPQKEITKIFWYSKQNFQDDNPKIAKGIKENLIPQLIKDKLVL